MKRCKHYDQCGEMVFNNQEVCGYCQQEAEIERLRSAAQVVAASQERIIQGLEQERDQLKVTIETMRMQLMVLNDIAGESMGDKSYDWHVRATNATNSTYDLLKKTPVQCLAAHDAEVIERARCFAAYKVLPDGSAEDYDLQLAIVQHQLRASAEEVKS